MILLTCIQYLFTSLLNIHNGSVKYVLALSQKKKMQHIERRYLFFPITALYNFFKKSFP